MIVSKYDPDFHKKHYRKYRKQCIKRNRKYKAEHRVELLEKAKQYYRTAHVKRPWQNSFTAAKRRAVEKELPCDLTKEWCIKNWSGKCSITGIPFTDGYAKNLDKGKGNYSNPYSPSLDRIDPKKGYTQDNCRFILHGINSMKHTGTDNDLLKMCLSVVENSDKLRLIQ